jgi:hypothetical protein
VTIEARFACIVCGREAGTIELRGDELRRESFTGVLTRRVGARRCPRLARLDPRPLPPGHERMLED